MFVFNLGHCSLKGLGQRNRFIEESAQFAHDRRHLGHWSCASAGPCALEQVQREAAARDYANLRLQQAYERALYDQDLALQTRRWHVSEYEAVVGDLRPDDLRVRTFLMPLCPLQGAEKDWTGLGTQLADECECALTRINVCCQSSCATQMQAWALRTC